MGDEGVVLTDRERQALAGLAESIGDPWLARQLVGQDTPPPGRKRRFAGAERGVERFNRAAGSLLGAIVLVIAGATLAVMTFTHSTVAASAGLLLMGAGLWRIVADRGDVIVRRLMTQRRIPTAVPPPPHTPPGAA